MILFLTTSVRKIYSTVRIQINDKIITEFDCLKTDSIHTVLKKASIAVKENDENEKKALLNLLDPNLFEKKINELKNRQHLNHDYKKIETYLKIVNISEKNQNFCEYQIFLNEHPIGNFKHTREDGLAVCLDKSAKSIPDKITEKFSDILFYEKREKNEKRIIKKRY